MIEHKNKNGCASRISISDDVTAVIAGAAAMDARGTVWPSGRLGKKNYGKGIKIVTSGGKAVIDINISVNFGCKIRDVCEEVQKNVKNAVETMTGLEVQEVNVNVTGVAFEKSRREEAVGDGA